MRFIFLMGFAVVSTDLIASCLPKYRFEAETKATCDDGILNGTEADVDCGGDQCQKCELGQSCRAASDCSMDSCAGRICQAAHCDDNAFSGGETDVDCGGDECAPCGVSQRCDGPTDCRSHACIDKRCVATGCDDGEMGGSETGLDCGGGTCPPCGLGKRCLSGGDCSTGICLEGQCTSMQCGDGVQSPGEQGVDCGGTCSKPCDPAAACSDGKKNGLETDEDCGGGTCARCDSGQACLLDDDCATNTCLDGRCALDPCPAATAPCEEPLQTGGGGSGGASGGSAGAQGGEPAGGSPPTGEGGMGGASGLGGSSPAGGVSGSAGESQGGAPGGMGGSAGSNAATAGTPSGGVGGAGPLTSCPGCARLTVPLTAENEKANFVIILPGPTDFSRARLRFRVYRAAGTGGSLIGYVQRNGTPDYNQLFQRQPFPIASVNGWTDIFWDVGGQSTTYDKTNVARVGIQVTAAFASNSWANPTVIYLDSITAVGVSVGAWNFDSPSSVSPDDTFYGPINVLWRNEGDYSVAGSRVSWLGP